MKITKLRCSGLNNPLGLKWGKLEFSWILQSQNQNVRQQSCRLIVNDAEDGSIIWDTGVVETASQSCCFSPEEKLQSGKRYAWHVLAWDNRGENAVSGTASFTMGLKRGEWLAQWIGCQEKDLDETVKMADKKEMTAAFLAMVSGEENAFIPDRKLNPCHIYRKVFRCGQQAPQTSFLSVTAHGLYRVQINGTDVTDTRLNPGFTAYDSYLEYQTYEVGGLLKAGENVITAVLADGWYRGKYGILGYGNNYGTELALLLQLDIDYGDGRRETVISDMDFRYHQSAYLYSDLLIGEKQDGRMDRNEFASPEFDDSAWERAAVKNGSFDVLQGISAEPVRCTDVMEAKEILLSPKGETIVDFGQVMVGVVRIEAEGSEGDTIRLEHSEVLDKQGNFTNNVSGYNRDQTDYFICSGKGTEIFEPEFTFHGFRYVKVTGYPGILSPEKIKAVVLGSDLEETGEFLCSDTRLNQLQSNIRWSQRGNMLSIPTDCPQRERAGWTGDILVYAKTAAYNQNVKQFLRKWLKNMEKEQFSDGLIPIIVPYPIAYSAMQKEAFGTETSAGWGDAAVIVPWVLYSCYGDREILEESFEMMVKWMQYVEADASSHMPELQGLVTEERRERQKYLWNTGFHFGDWCYPSCKNDRGETDMFRSAYTTKEYAATAMYAYSTDVMSRVCAVLGKTEQQNHYQILNEKIRKAFSDEYVNGDGTIGGVVQGVYVLALAMKMAEGEKLKNMAARLAEMIAANDDRLDTGFLSIEHLLDVLTEYGYQDIARRLLYQERCPSWLYEINSGATTIWETWNAVLEDGTPTDNSFNHYAFGCVGDWMYRNLLGIKRVKPGYEEFLIKPDFSYGLVWAKGAYQSRYGRIECQWHLDGNQGELAVTVPVGTRAVMEAGEERMEVGSGSYIMKFQLTAGRECA